MRSKSRGHSLIYLSVLALLAGTAPLAADLDASERKNSVIFFPGNPAPLTLRIEGSGGNLLPDFKIALENTKLFKTITDRPFAGADYVITGKLKFPGSEKDPGEDSNEIPDNFFSNFLKRVGLDSINEVQETVSLEPPPEEVKIKLKAVVQIRDRWGELIKSVRRKKKIVLPYERRESYEPEKKEFLEEVAQATAEEILTLFEEDQKSFARAMAQEYD